jgi:MFS family permease
VPRGADQREGYPPPDRAWLVLGALGAATIAALIDRQLVNLMVDPIRRTLSISDSQFGVIQGLAFVLFYTFMGVPIGRMADRMNRRNLIVIGILLWSLMTFLCGLAHNFWQLFAARAGVGVGEAVLMPAGFSMLADYFPPARRGRAMALVSMCSAFGNGASFMLGGAVLHAVPGDSTVVLPLLGATLGWQLAFYVAATPGVLVALLLLLIREPVRRETGGLGEKTSLDWSTVGRYLSTETWPLFCLIMGGSLLALNGVALSAWAASHFIRGFGLSAAYVGFALGTVTAVHGIIGGPLGGILGDALARRRLGGRIDTYLIAALAGLPFLIAWPLVSQPWFAFLLFMGAMVAILVGSVVSSAAITEIVPNRMRGLVLSAYSAFSGIIGAGLGPVSVALVAEHVFGGKQALTAGLVAVTTPAMVMVGLLALAGRASFARACQRVIDGASESASRAPLAPPAGLAAIETTGIGKVHSREGSHA